MFSRKPICMTMHRWVPAILVILATWMTLAARPAPLPTSAPGGQRPPAPQQTFTADQRARISEQALAHLRQKPELRNQRLRVLSVKPVLPEKEDAQTPTASVIVFNYSQGNAKRLILDPTSGAVLREETLRGRPQPSEEEVEEARQILRADAEHRRL